MAGSNFSVFRGRERVYTAPLHVNQNCEYSDEYVPLENEDVGNGCCECQIEAPYPQPRYPSSKSHSRGHCAGHGKSSRCKISQRHRSGGENIHGDNIPLIESGDPYEASNPTFFPIDQLDNYNNPCACCLHRHTLLQLSQNFMKGQTPKEDKDIVERRKEAIKPSNGPKIYQDASTSSNSPIIYPDASTQSNPPKLYPDASTQSNPPIIYPSCPTPKPTGQKNVKMCKTPCSTTDPQTCTPLAMCPCEIYDDECLCAKPPSSYGLELQTTHCIFPNVQEMIEDIERREKLNFPKEPVPSVPCVMNAKEDNKKCCCYSNLSQDLCSPLGRCLVRPTQMKKDMCTCPKSICSNDARRNKYMRHVQTNNVGEEDNDNYCICPFCAPPNLSPGSRKKEEESKSATFLSKRPSPPHSSKQPPNPTQPSKQPPNPTQPSKQPPCSKPSSKQLSLPQRDNCNCKGSGNEYGSGSGSGNRDRKPKSRP